MPSFSEVREQAEKLYQDLTVRQKLISAAVIFTAVAGFVALFVLTNQPNYRTLYSDLSPDDAADVVNWLKNEKIPYRISDAGSTIKVPEDKVYETRLALASSGLPKGGSVGFEIFDKSGLGVTDFVQHINYLRALQGELERTIEQFPQVKSARVHLAQPKESLFTSEKREPTASVVLTLKHGEELERSQVQGIVHLVANAVPRLKKDNITVVDTEGQVLFENQLPQDNLSNLTSAQLIYQRRLESYYKHKIQSMLEDALGPNRAIARVSAEIDFDRVKVNEERYDPDMVAIRSEQKLKETQSGQEPGGIPGVKGGLATKLQGNLGQADSGTVTTKEQNTTNYEITRTQRQVNGAIGKLKRLSVAVLVDGTYKEKNGKATYIPRTPEEMAKLQQIVKAAMGFSEERGDDISLVNVPFNSREPAQPEMARILDVGTKLLKPLANLILALLFIFLVIKPLLKKYVFVSPQEEGMAHLPEGEGGMGDMELPEPEPMPALKPMPNPQERLQNLAHEYPERAAALIKVWLREKMEEDKDKKDGSRG